MMKRPNKAEKLARQVNAPISTRPRERSLSPDLESAPSTIPLFNTSARRKGTGHHIAGLGGQEALVPGAREAEARRASDRERLEEQGMEVGEAVVDGGLKRKKGLKDKVKAAREVLAADEGRSERKLGGKPDKKKVGVLGGGELLMGRGGDAMPSRRWWREDGLGPADDRSACVDGVALKRDER